MAGRADQADVEAAQRLTGVFTGLDDTQRAYPTISLSSRRLDGCRRERQRDTAEQSTHVGISNGTTVIRGRHTLSFGASYRRWKLDRDLANNFLGDYAFSGDFSGHPIG